MSKPEIQVDEIPNDNFEAPKIPKEKDFQQKEDGYPVEVKSNEVSNHSDEGDVDCLGIFDVPVKRFVPTLHEEKVPCMGWNKIYDTKSPLMAGVDSRYVYFVHSYYVPLCQETIAIADYIQPYSAALHKDNFYATQFHPEKSGDVGERIIKNFLEL